MKIFIDIDHPAQVHFFRNFIKIMKEHVHEFCITARDKEFVFYLLNYFQIPFIARGKGAETLIGKALYLFKANFLIFRIVKRYKPDITISFGSPYLSQVAWLMNIPDIVVNDNESNKLFNTFTYPFTSKVLTPCSFRNDFKNKQVRFNAHWPIAYLHPKYFTSDEYVHKLLGISREDKYVIVRWVSRKTTHDIGKKGVPDSFKIKVIKALSQYAKVFVSSEIFVPAEIESYKINIPPYKMHDVMHSAHLLFGESATMSAEAALLGTPSIYCDPDGRGFTKELEKKYNIVFNFKTTKEQLDAALQKGIEILSANNKNEYLDKSDFIIKNSIDLTEFLVDFIENYNSE
ncbi:MAG: DUF354 domain-containing protein [Bacteroidia bacterium]|nr:DUF354 domain-containing protein [Bacteroidia bacterium]